MAFQPEASRQPTRDARAWAAGAEARFTGMFRPGYYLYISAMDLGPPTWSHPDVRASPPRAPRSRSRNPCLPPGTCDGRCTANPVQLVEYALVGTAADPDREHAGAAHHLAINGQPLAGTQLVLADHAVDLQFWGTYDTRQGPAAPPVIAADPDPTDDVGNWPGVATESLALNVRPERVRSLNVLLATRTPRPDPSFVAQVPMRAPADRMWFMTSPLLSTGLARVATLVSEVETPNIYRGVQ
ncbi:MAG: hypothetical protein R3F43_25135 [bacterium]